MVWFAWINGSQRGQENSAFSVIHVTRMPDRSGQRLRAEGSRPTRVQTPVRVNVTCVTPLGDEIASTS
jgi:hypothetical protein